MQMEEMKKTNELDYNFTIKTYNDKCVIDLNYKQN